MMQNNAAYKVGITGGIGSGKSEMTRFLRSKGYFVVDADQIAREVVEPGRPGLNKIVDRFGTEVLTVLGTLNRAQLGKIIFENSEARLDLNALLHPLIQEEIKKRMDEMNHLKYVFADVPLLFETQSDDLYDETVLVYAPEVVCLNRIMSRDGIGLEFARKKLSVQMPMDEKVKRASYVLYNSDSLEVFHTQIEMYLKALESR